MIMIWFELGAIQSTMSFLLPCIAINALAYFQVGAPCHDDEYEIEVQVSVCWKPVAIAAHFNVTFFVFFNNMNEAEVIVALGHETWKIVKLVRLLFKEPYQWLLLALVQLGRSSLYMQMVTHVKNQCYLHLNNLVPSIEAFLWFQV